MVDVFFFGGIEDCAVVDGDVVYHSECPFGGDADTGVAANDAADVDVAEFGDEIRRSIVGIVVSGLAAGGAVSV